MTDTIADGLASLKPFLEAHHCSTAVIDEAIGALTPTASVPAELVERTDAMCRLIERRAPDGDNRVLIDEDIADQLAADIRTILAALPPAGRVEEMREALSAFIDAWEDIDEPFQPQMPRLVQAARAALSGEGR